MTLLVILLKLLHGMPSHLLQIKHSLKTSAVIVKMQAHGVCVLLQLGPFLGYMCHLRSKTRGAQQSMYPVHYFD